MKLLEGDSESGLADIQKAYERDDYIGEALIIALMECGQMEEAEGWLEKFEEEGAEFPEKFWAYINGELSLYDYYVDERRDEKHLSFLTSSI